MWTWILNHKAEIVLFLHLLAAVVIVSLVASFSPETDPPSVPEVAQTVQIQEAVTSAITQVKVERTTNDEAIKNAYRIGKESVANLSADAVVLELNLLLDELRGGSARQQR